MAPATPRRRPLTFHFASLIITESGVFRQACHIGPDSSNTFISLACQKERPEDHLHDSLLENNNNNSILQPAQQQGMLTPSSVVEHQAALRAQHGYEKLCSSAYETQSYSHFF